MSVKEYGDISGVWYNELGSKMNITQCANGVLEGLYHNSAPDSSDESQSLVGSMGKGVPTTLGFVVNFEDGKYTTAWSGQYQKDAAGVEVIMTTWLMTTNFADSSLYWEAVNVGQDRFTRMEKLRETRGRKSLTAKHAK